jgi:predicted dehydrogenase
LLLASAPCNVLGEAAQTLWLALRKNAIGRVRLVYAELDDDFLLQAPYKKWTSASGAPWPFRDEFMVGCTLEHAGYYVSWLLAMFGRVEKVVAASANLIVAKLCNSQTAPDFSCASLFFASGVVARLTCSIVAPRDHAIRIIGDDGVLELEENWNNDAPVRLRRRYVVRRRLVNSPLARRLRLGQSTHPKVRRWGAPGMDFALASVEMLDALAQSRPCRLSAEFALHLTEVVLAIQNTNGAQAMTTDCPPMAPMPWASQLTSRWI